jgi:hypothetical protein
MTVMTTLRIAAENFTASNPAGTTRQAANLCICVALDIEVRTLPFPHVQPVDRFC